MDQVKAKIAFQLKSLRTKKNYTQEYVAELLKMGDYTAYHRLEHGKTILKFEVAFKLAKIFGVKMEELMNPIEKDQDECDNLQRDSYLWIKKNSLQLVILLDGDEINLARQIELLKEMNGFLATKI